MGEFCGDSMNPPTACFVLPTLDRGAKLFGGKDGYESGRFIFCTVNVCQMICLAIFSHINTTIITTLMA